jgi:hypothetical protein
MVRRARAFTARPSSSFMKTTSFSNGFGVSAALYLAKLSLKANRSFSPVVSTYVPIKTLSSTLSSDQKSLSILIICLARCHENFALRPRNI